MRDVQLVALHSVLFTCAPSSFMDSALPASLGQAPATRDRPFNPFRCPRTDRAKTLVVDVVRELERFEDSTGARRRKRRAEDQVTLQRTVSAIVCDLAHRALTDPGGRVAVPLSKSVLGRAGRYNAPALGKTLPIILERMAAPQPALLELVKGHQGHFGPARQSTMRAAPALVRRIEEEDLSLEDLGREARGPAVCR